MSYRIELENRARKEFINLPTAIAERIEDAIDSLGQNPRPMSSKKLVGQKGYRVRQGDYRILYTIDDKTKLVRIYRIGHRREIYR